MRITYLIIFICVIVFFLEQSETLLPHLVLQPVSLFERPWTLFFSLFSHADLEHLFFNMFALFMFGPVLEDRIGSGRFLFVYLLAGLVGGIGFMLFNSPFDTALGASGAIYGILGALVLLTPNLTVYFYLVPIPMWIAGPVYALIEIFALGSADNIAHSAHLLGFAGGLLLVARERGPAWPPKPPMELWKALGIPIALSLMVGLAFGAYYLSDPVNSKMLGCENKDTASLARSCFLGISKEYKNSPQQQAYICSEYDRLFQDNSCRGV